MYFLPNRLLLFDSQFLSFSLYFFSFPHLFPAWFSTLSTNGEENQAFQLFFFNSVSSLIPFSFSFITFLSPFRSFSPFPFQFPLPFPFPLLFSPSLSFSPLDFLYLSTLIRFPFSFITFPLPSFPSLLLPSFPSWFPLQQPEAGRGKRSLYTPVSLSAYPSQVSRTRLRFAW